MQGRRNRGSRGEVTCPLPSFLADQLTLSHPGSRLCLPHIYVTPPPDFQTFGQPRYDDDVHSAAVAATTAVDATTDVVRPVFTLLLGKVFNVEQNGKKLPHVKRDMCLFYLG